MNKNILLHAHQSKRSDEQYLISMINIVFLLLIFFMLLGQISFLVPNGIKVPELRQDNPELHANQLVFYIDNEGGIIFEEKNIPMASLPSLLDERVNQEVLLYLDKELKAKVLDEILSTLREEKIKSVKLFTRNVS